MEIWDAYLSDGTKAGVDLIRGKEIPKGLYHLVCEIIVRHIDGDYLLMQRDPRKPNYGGMFEATASGSALKGEAPLTGAKRELLEETGLIANRIEIMAKKVASSAGCTSETCTIAIAHILDKNIKQTPIDDGGIIVDRVWVKKNNIKQWLREKEEAGYVLTAQALAGLFYLY